MKFMKTFIAIALAAQVMVSSAAHAQVPGFTISFGGAGSCALVINGQNVGGCVTTFTGAYQYGSGIYIFAIGSDAHPYYYSYYDRTWNLVSADQSINRITGSAQASDGSVVLSANTTGNIPVNFAAGIYVGAPGTANTTLNIAAACNVTMNGANIGGCVMSITRPYQFGSDEYIFAAG